MTTMLDLITKAQRTFDAAKSELDMREAAAQRLKERMEAGDKTVRDADVDALIQKVGAARSAFNAEATKMAQLRAEQAEDERAAQGEFRPTGVAAYRGRDREYGFGDNPGVRYLDHEATASKRGHLSLRGAAALVRDAANAERADYSIRGLLAVGSTHIAPTVLSSTPIDMGKPATGLLDIIPVRTVEGGTYSYLRQTVRTNNAAPVAVGAVKPTSVMTLTRVNGTLETVAHLSEAIPEKWLEDARELDTFVQDELAAGLNSALEDQLLNGTGVSPELDGIVATATGTQAYATSPLVTIRTALSQLEAAGLTPTAVVLAAADWLAIETATLTAGGYVLGQGTNGAPLDAIRRTVWGVPVVVSVAHTAGTAVVLSEDSVGLVTDGGIEFVWGRINDDFQRNQVRGRAEIRAAVEVTRPAGIIVCDLTA